MASVAPKAVLFHWRRALALVFKGENGAMITPYLQLVDAMLTASREGRENKVNVVLLTCLLCLVFLHLVVDTYWRVCAVKDCAAIVTGGGASVGTGGAAEGRHDRAVGRAAVPREVDVRGVCARHGESGRRHGATGGPQGNGGGTG